MATSPEPSRGREHPRIPRRPPEEELAEIRNVSFPPALRGYDREAVDAYVVRVNWLLAELEATRSPEAAIERALDQVGEETSGILQRARETSEEITARSRAQADDRVQLAEREAQGVREEAEARVRELNEDAEAVWQERNRMIEDARALAEELLSVADAAAERWPAAELEEARAREAELAPTEVYDQGEPAMDRRAGEAGEPLEERGQPELAEPYGQAERYEQAEQSEQEEAEQSEQLYPGEPYEPAEAVEADPEPGATGDRIGAEKELPEPAIASLAPEDEQGRWPEGGEELEPEEGDEVVPAGPEYPPPAEEPEPWAVRELEAEEPDEPEEAEEAEEPDEPEEVPQRWSADEQPEALDDSTAEIPTVDLDEDPPRGSGRAWRSSSG